MNIQYFRALAAAAMICVPMSTKAIQVFPTLINPSACGAPNGAIEIQVTGGTAPFTFVWSNGATTANIYNLLPGAYSVTVTDALSDQANGFYEVEIAGLTLPQCAQDGHCSCINSMGGQVQIIEWTMSGTPPYSYNPPPDGFDPQGDPYFSSFGSPVGSVIAIEVTDANGCTGISYQTVHGPAPAGGSSMQLVSTSGSCTGTSGGSVTIANVNDPLFYLNPNPALTVLDQAQQYVTGVAEAGASVTFNSLPPGNYTIQREWDPTDYLMAYSCEGNPYDQLNFTIADLGTNCNSVSGTVFLEYDEDCAQDGNEIGVPYQVLAIEPGGQLAITDGDGAFSRDLLTGNYTLAQTDPTLVQLCPVASPVPFTIGSQPVVIDLADSSTVPLDLDARLESSAMRPGFAGTYWGWARNRSPQLSGPVTVTLTIDADLVFTSATPTPSSVAGNTITWDLAPFTAFAGQYFSVQVSVPMGTPLGTPVNSSLAVSNTLGDDDLSDNTATDNSIVTGSYDPNDKTATTSSAQSDALFFINEDEWIDYLIRFQNTGTDTAFTVVITDTLAAELDMASFQQGVASHAFSVSFKPGRVIEWRFEDIQLPDSNVNEAASHGAVSFRIKPVLPLMAGTVIENTANIFFDFNPPVITEPSVLVAEFITGVSSVEDVDLTLSPVPATDQLRVTSSTMIRSLRVITADGREVLSERIDAHTTMLDIGRLASGVYVLASVDADGTMTTVRFTKTASTP